MYDRPDTFLTGFSKEYEDLDDSQEADKICPRRLIYVGSQAENSRIIDCEKSGQGMKYMTLSHRWPTTIQKEHDPIFELTTKNIAAVSESLHLPSLTKTFQDAIQLTRFLGAQYIWIDALCILQDSEVDWRCESAKMGSIYSNAVLNIAAAEDFDAEHGLFRTRDVSLDALKPLKVDIDWANTIAGEKFIQNYWGHSPRNPTPAGTDETAILPRECYIVQNDTKRHTILSLPVNQRGWVLQERLLSPRTITFTSSQVIFDSPVFSASESFPNGFLYHNNSTGTKHQPIRWYSPSYTVQLASRSVTETREELLREWDIVVGLYTACNLTRRSDKLIAIKGLEQSFRKYYHEYLDPHPEDDCIAGIWKSAMPRALAWRVKNYKSSRCPGSLAQRFDDKVCIPSWSWACTNAEVEINSPANLPSRSSIHGTEHTSLGPVVEVVPATPALNEEDGRQTAQPPRIQMRAYLVSMRDMEFWHWEDDAMGGGDMKSPVIRPIAAFLHFPRFTCTIDDRDEFSKRFTVGRRWYLKYLSRFLALMGTWILVLWVLNHTYGISLDILSHGLWGILIVIIFPGWMPRLWRDDVNEGLCMLWFKRGDCEDIPRKRGLVVVRDAGKGDKYRRVGCVEVVLPGPQGKMEVFEEDVVLI